MYECRILRGYPGPPWQIAIPAPGGSGRRIQATTPVWPPLNGGDGVSASRARRRAVVRAPGRTKKRQLPEAPA
jgi:hypothetical protein